MSTAITSLPPVAKSFFALCKKCDADRYHTVLAHTTSTSAKLKCEVCGSTKSWSLPRPGKPGAKTSAAVTQRRANTEAARKTAYQGKYEALLKASTKEEKYSMKASFEMNQKLAHPKFGMGIVTGVYADKVEVFFEDETRFLIHNRV